MKRIFIAFSLLLIAVSSFSQLFSTEKLLNYKESLYENEMWNQLISKI